MERASWTDVPEGTIIVVEGGDVFEGTPEQWADCFFSNAFRSVIEEFCRAEGWSVEFVDGAV